MRSRDTLFSSRSTAAATMTTLTESIKCKPADSPESAVSTKAADRCTWLLPAGDRSVCVRPPMERRGTPLVRKRGGALLPDSVCGHRTLGAFQRWPDRARTRPDACVEAAWTASFGPEFNTRTLIVGGEEGERSARWPLPLPLPLPPPPPERRW
ncbi:Hypothetical predicted protein [Cloeon dipterum]|uniref:Uncharacterized protein n=1 Tax=Cloeon dipterum TaxID=197152 RepID=A0A8S1CAH6_9INSE|nr:Hypothetical predicted protein [Cloeon dipterum]